MEQQDPPLITPERMVTGIVVSVILIVAGVGYHFRPRAALAADGMSQYWDASVEQTQALHRPALVLFTADWCPACNALHSQVLSRSDIQQEIANHYTLITIDLTAQAPHCVARAQKYGVSGIPALIRFDADGKESDRTHYLPPEQMLTWLHEGE